MWRRQEKKQGNLLLMGTPLEWGLDGWVGVRQEGDNENGMLNRRNSMRTKAALGDGSRTSPKSPPSEPRQSQPSHLWLSPADPACLLPPPPSCLASHLVLPAWATLTAGLLWEGGQVDPTSTPPNLPLTIPGIPKDILAIPALTPNTQGHLWSRATSLPILLLGFIIFPSVTFESRCSEVFVSPGGKKVY